MDRRSALPIALQKPISVDKDLRSATRYPSLAAVAILVVGYALRLWRLDALSISGDEVISIGLATRPLGVLLATLATSEPHPPFYYGLLHFWLPVAGQSEFALRFPSVLLGTLGVASAYATGRFVGGRWAGLATAAIFAASQFSVLEAQNGRMYAALQAWAALYLAGLIRWAQRPDRRSGVVVALAGTLAVYTHYHGALLVALGVVPVVLSAPRRELWGRLRPFGAILALYLPWVISARTLFLTYRGWERVVPPLEALDRSLVTYSVGQGVEGNVGSLALTVLPCFALVGLVALAVGRHWRPGAVLLGLGVLPLAAAIAGTLAGRPLYEERYLIVVTPAYFALAGWGLAFLSRWLVPGALAWAALLGLGAVTLSAYYWPTLPLNPDFRATVALIERQADAPAAVVMPAPQGPIVDYYLKDRLPNYTSGDNASPDVVAAALTTRLAGTREVWFVRYQSGTWDAPIGRWLEANAFYLRDHWVTQNRLSIYALAPPGSVEDWPVGARVGDLAEITAARSGPDEVRPGDRVLAGLRWTRIGAGIRAIPPSIKVSLRLIDPWGQAIDQLDRPLVNPAQLPDSHAPQVWQGALPVPPDAVPGHYRKEAIFYDEASGRVLPVVDASGADQPALDLGSVTVDPVPTSALDPKAPLDASAVSVGHGLYAQMIQLSPGPYTPDSRLAASFVWVARAAPGVPVVPELAIRSLSGDIVASAKRAVDQQPYPLSRLRAGERVRERLEVALRAITQPGTYTVVLRTGPADPWTALGTIDVAVDPARYVPPVLGEERSDLFDGTIRLVGATLPAEPVTAGSSFSVSLGWHAERLPTAQYTVFVHLDGRSGKPLAQDDSPPDGGRRPTLDWILGEYVLDRHQIAVPDTLAPGTYPLTAGLYQTATGQRAKLVGPDAHGDEVELGSITIRPSS
jgi:4-amino-4-deoxy-L-arabinose transferase-like glycosyltransferase